VHLQRLHYWAVSKGLAMPSGEPYENTKTCRAYLTAASAGARILKEVDAERFVDRRNDAPRLYREPSVDGARDDPEVWLAASSWAIPDADAIDVSMITDAIAGMVQVRDALTRPLAGGFEYRFDDDHPVIEDVWVEKSTMDDVLDPLCREEHVNYARATGFESITHAIELIRRCEDHNKPGHVIYVSDFDPAGEGMPIAVARQLQFWLDVLNSDAQITLEQVALTRDQVIEYRLPRTPIKKDDVRKEGFEDRHGEGAVELDALEALRPGELAQIVRRAVRRHVDEEYRDRLNDARREASDTIDEARGETNGPELAAEAAENNAAAREIVAELGEEIAALIAERLEELAPLREGNEELAREAAELVEGLDVELPDRPDVEINGADDEVLFDSDRDRLDQLDAFRAFKAHEAGEDR
jgi:hypothetical protein